MKKWSALAWLAVVFVACGGQALAAVTEGTWGGQHLVLELESSGATLQFDCAHGSFDGALTLDAKGHFERTGVFVRQHGGPVRKDEVEDARPARFTGSVDGDTMKITVTLVDGSLPAQEYTLKLGSPGRIFRCY